MQPAFHKQGNSLSWQHRWKSKNNNRAKFCPFESYRSAAGFYSSVSGHVPETSKPANGCQEFISSVGVGRGFVFEPGMQSLSG